MARLNIETQIWSDPRFYKLMIRLGNRHEAMGQLLDLWRLSQAHWFPERRCIPEEAWIESELSSVLVDCGLAEKRDEGYYAKGSEEQFAWLFEKRAAGKISAQRPRDDKGRLLPKANTVQQESSTSQQPRASVQQPPSSFLFPLSSSLLSQNSLLSAPNSLSENEPKKPRTSPEALRARAGLKEFWLNLFQKTFGHSYAGSDSVFFNTTIKRIHESLGSEKALEAMKNYLEWSDPFISKRGHPLHLLLQSLHGLEAAKHRPEQTMGMVAQGRAAEKVLTTSEQRLQEMRMYGERSKRVNGLGERYGGELPERPPHEVLTEDGGLDGTVIYDQASSNDP